MEVRGKLQSTNAITTTADNSYIGKNEFLQGVDIGDISSSINPAIRANVTGHSPAIQYNKLTRNWQLTNDGTNWADIDNSIIYNSLVTFPSGSTTLSINHVNADDLYCIALQPEASQSVLLGFNTQSLYSVSDTAAVAFGSNKIQFNDITSAVPIMTNTNNATVNGNVIVINSSLDNTQVYKAFDGNGTTYIQELFAGDWITVDFAVPKIIKSVKIKTTVAGGTIQGSNDNNNWTVIKSNYSWTTFSDLTVNINNTTAYRYYAIAGNNGGGNMYSISLYESDFLHSTIVTTDNSNINLLPIKKISNISTTSSFPTFSTLKVLSSFDGRNTWQYYDTSSNTWNIQSNGTSSMQLTSSIAMDLSTLQSGFTNFNVLPEKQLDLAFDVSRVDTSVYPYLGNITFNTITEATIINTMQLGYTWQTINSMYSIVRVDYDTIAIKKIATAGNTTLNVILARKNSKDSLLSSSSSGSNIAGYVKTFNATTDWGIVSGDGYYYMNFSHKLNVANVIVQIYEGTDFVLPDKIINVDTNNVQIRVTGTPNMRFAGKTIITGFN